MRSGLCPKCQTPTVYRKQYGLQHGDTAHMVSIYTKGWVNTPSPVDFYICTRCGLFERYVVDAQKMAEVTSTWEKVARLDEAG